MTINVVPWILAGAGAAWFGWSAWRTGRNWIAASLTGGLFALVISTFVFGLGQAATTPFSDKERASLRLLWTSVSVCLVAGVGCLFTFWFWRKPAPKQPVDGEKAPPPTTRAGEKRAS